MKVNVKNKAIYRAKIEIHGAVQGVGFRPFVCNLARELRLKGWVTNTTYGVVIEAEGKKEILKNFIIKIKKEKPTISSIQSLQCHFLDPLGYKDFSIRESSLSNEKTALIMPDIATCLDCLKELFNPQDRRYYYPFINCTHCGPRFSIIKELPYDRPNTSMKNFTMCDECKREYSDPANRRFHAQPNACQKCGPHVELCNSDGKRLAIKSEAIHKAVQSIKGGKIVAVKGLGGFHLVVDATNEESINLLRSRKHREEKPFALMFPYIGFVNKYCEISEEERQLLTANEAPIVLVKKKKNTLIAEEVALNNPYLGVMLPYTPLHHILMRELNIPVVATSANLSDDTICYDNEDALNRLSGIADLFLFHNRPIVRHVDDSISRVVAGNPQLLRRARGYAPLGLRLKKELPFILALGGHLKNTVALSVKDNVVISQHIGDLETKQSFESFEKISEDLPFLYDSQVVKVACDMHPEYFSTKRANYFSLPVVKVQHHHAHIVSCMAENHLDEDVLGVAFDGTGYGIDNTIWGGEFLISNLKNFKRVGHIRTFVLPGGDIAIKEPRRTAVALLSEIYNKKIFTLPELPCKKSFDSMELNILLQMVEKRINSPTTSSVGRLFDGVSSIIGLKQYVNFEGQAAMALEYEAEKVKTKELYKYKVIKNNSLYIVDWEQIIVGIIEDLQSEEKTGKIAAKFHNTLVEIIVDLADRVKKDKVVLSGGCFQNKYLTEKAIERLEEEGFKPYWHQLVPPNDGGISLGQVVVADN